MSFVDKFLEYCEQTLEADFGRLSSGIIKKAQKSQELNEKSGLKEINEFIGKIEANISLVAGKNKAADICNKLKIKVVELSESQNDVPVSSDIDKAINVFLTEKNLPTDADISDYAKYLTIKFDVDAKEIKKDLIEKVKKHIKDRISILKINDEINKFLSKYEEPAKSDVDDFISYLGLLNLDFEKEELYEIVEKERLFRKFRDEEEEDGVSELDEFIVGMKSKNDKKSIKKEMQKHKISYLIKDEDGISDQMLAEFSDMVTPKEEDIKGTLEDLGLEHMVEK